MTLVKLIQSQMRNFEQEQKLSYETKVMPAILSNDLDNLNSAYKAYIESLNHFDVAAFRKTIARLQEDTNEVLSNYSDQFQFVASYAIERNNFDKKRKEIFEMDGTSADKQAVFDTLDRRRTIAHNGVIRLFNNLNKYASENEIAAPYPNMGMEYDPKNPTDRAHVAEVLETHQTLLENVNHMIVDELNENNVPSTADKFRSMSIKQLYEYAKANQMTDSLDDLSNIENAL